MSNLSVSQRVQFINQTGIDLAQGKILLSELNHLIKQKNFEKKEETEVYYFILREAEKFIRQHSISKDFLISSLVAILFGSLVCSVYFFIPEEWRINAVKIMVIVYGFMLVGLLLAVYGIARVILYIWIVRRNKKRYPDLISLKSLPLRNISSQPNDEINFVRWFDILPFWRHLF
jgi:hypothetical protein